MNHASKFAHELLTSLFATYHDLSIRRTQAMLKSKTERHQILREILLFVLQYIKEKKTRTPQPCTFQINIISPPNGEDF